MKVLVACEESQTVCKAFRERGHEAYSCDIQDCSGGHPEWHIKGDALKLINGRCSFVTEGGAESERSRPLGPADRTSAVHIFEPCHNEASFSQSYKPGKCGGQDVEAGRGGGLFHANDACRLSAHRRRKSARLYVETVPETGLHRAPLSIRGGAGRR